MAKQYEVTMICKVRKVVTCEDCTEEQARSDPFNFASHEEEIEQMDWEVTDVDEVEG